MDKVKNVILSDENIAKVKRLKLQQFFELGKMLEEYGLKIAELENIQSRDLIETILNVGVDLDKILDIVLVENVEIFDIEDLFKILQGFIEVNELNRQKNFLMDKFKMKNQTLKSVQ